MATLRSLLADGYFPRELPPPFNSRSFARWGTKHGAAWSNRSWTRCVSHNLARPGGLRRPLRIPNPLAYFALADVVAKNWTAIYTHTWAQRLSASRPYLMKSGGRAIVPRYHYSELTRLRALRRRAARYVLVTDIDQFYPSIYTHSIPWALHGRSATKAALKSKKKVSGPRAATLGDALDDALRLMNDGQTHGIPIGPDTSLVIAEILLAAADAELLTGLGPSLRGFRYVDDYELSFETLSAAEDALTALQGVLASFELLLNPKKTSILTLPHPLDVEWSIALKSMEIRDKKHPVGQRNDLLALFSSAFALAASHPSDSVLRYAVSRVQGMNVHATAWRTFHNCVLGAAASDGSTLPVALGTLFAVGARGRHSVPQLPLAEVLESVIARHAPRAQGSEVSWALWGAIAWKVPLSAKAAHLIECMEDDVVALLAMHADAIGLFPSGPLSSSRWSSLASDPNALDGEHWLLAYEANQQGWSRAPAVAKNPAFAAMSKAGVSFFDRTKTKPQFPNAGRSIPGGRLGADYA